MMKTATAAKVNNLRALLATFEFQSLPYNELEQLVYKRDNLPSTTTLRRYELLKVVRTEYYVNWYTTDELANNPDAYPAELLPKLEYDETRELWYEIEILNWYGVA